ncbi:hypothetical protein [Pseudonocardia sp.]|uniref:hypothetical protein n=1 Tax=Pseudonocardia sp. TaxID=60912 RepID=UPI003D0B956D
MWTFVWFVGTPVLVLLVALALERLQQVVVDAGPGTAAPRTPRSRRVAGSTPR